MDAKKLNPLDILPVLSNAAIIGIFATVLYGDHVGLAAALGALVLWSGILLYLSRPGAPEAPGTQNLPYLGSYDQTASGPQDRIRTGEDAEQILQAFRDGKEI